MLTAVLLGMGCKQLEQETRAALDSLDLEIPYELTIVTNPAEIARYGVQKTPALVLNNQVLCAGRIAKREEIIALIMDLLSPKAA